ncbi:hypothetical protein [Catellatospora bangladeshensis]|uniref:Uncharacterized protein n=1 Tax=Catellatospora bangladeshensis TaxID=310355 RepID=A0A8J3NM13_9ACTN|nr:hypothetical protein [Catellatospora bangladeshensis]GIF85720.1 hypothetical protein Cba03nite_70690 [Catellatospora bangladeshensis]
MTVDDLRARLTDEYGEERFTMTVSEIEQRAGRDPRRRLGAWAAVGAAAVVAAGFLVWPSPPAGEVAPLATASATPGATPSATSAPWHAGFAEDCRRKWLDSDRSKLAPEDRAELPPLRMEALEPELGIRVYGNDRVIADCERSPGGLGISMTYAQPTQRLLPDVGARIPRYGSISHLDGSLSEVASADYFVGRVPAGATRVDAVSPDGRVIEARLDGGLFLLWAPEGGLNDAIVRAHTATATILDSGVDYLPEEQLTESAEQICRAAADRGRVAGGPSQPPRRFSFRDATQPLLVHAVDGAVMVCDRSGNHVSLLTVSAADGAGTWQPMQWVADAGYGDGWIVGRAPAGAESGTVTLANGRKVALRFSGGWFAAWLAGKDGTAGALPRSVEVRAGGRTWTADGRQNILGPR